jgi:hypothetical protein
MCRAAPRWRDGLTDLAVTYYGETRPAARLFSEFGGELFVGGARGIRPVYRPPVLAKASRYLTNGKRGPGRILKS